MYLRYIIRKIITEEKIEGWSFYSSGFHVLSEMLGEITVRNEDSGPTYTYRKHRVTINFTCRNNICKVTSMKCYLNNITFGAIFQSCNLYIDARYTFSGGYTFGPLGQGYYDDLRSEAIFHLWLNIQDNVKDIIKINDNFDINKFISIRLIR